MNKEMSQLYSRVFLQILDSSIAEDFTVRHVFEDFLKLCDHKSGVVDMTRQALSRRLNVPIETLNRAIGILESPDLASRDMDFEGRRIERLDEHRDWGWKILNWDKYEGVRTKADVYLRVSRHREKVAETTGRFIKPSVEEVKLQFSKIGLPMSEAERFHDFYESNGWRVGKNPMRSWTSAAANWKRNMEGRRQPAASGNVAVIQNQTALNRVEERIKYLRGQFPLTDQKLKAEWNTLKADRSRLMGLLGFKV